MLWFDMFLYLSTQLLGLAFTSVVSGAVKRAGPQPMRAGPQANDCPYGYSWREIPAFKTTLQRKETEDLRSENVNLCDNSILILLK